MDNLRSDQLNWRSLTYASHRYTLYQVTNTSGLCGRIYHPNSVEFPTPS